MTEKIAWICVILCKLDLNIGSIDHVIVQIKHCINCGFEAAITDGMVAASNLLNKDKFGVIGKKLLGAEPVILNITI